MLEVDDMPTIDRLAIPDEFYTVLDAPGCLAGMVRPSERTPWERLAASGYRYVVCLTDDLPAYDPAPLEVLHSVCLEDLHGGLTPSDPDREAERILAATDRVVGAIRAGDGVIVHCAGGTGRTGTVIGAVLRRLGYPADGIRVYLDRLHRRRDSGWPESEWAGRLLDRIEPG